MAPRPSALSLSGSGRPPACLHPGFRPRGPQRAAGSRHRSAGLGRWPGCVCCYTPKKRRSRLCATAAGLGTYRPSRPGFLGFRAPFPGANRTRPQCCICASRCRRPVPTCPSSPLSGGRAYAQRPSPLTPFSSAYSCRCTEGPEAGVQGAGGAVTVRCHYTPSPVNRHQRKYWCRLSSLTGLCRTLVSTNRYTHLGY